MALVQEAQVVLSTRKVKETLLKSARKVVQRHKSIQIKRERRVANKKTAEKSMPPVEVDPGRCYSRYIPADVKHQVVKRDSSRCSYVSPDGRRCCETKNLEFDHRVPFALGGENTVKNLRLVCRSHNRMYADEVFGREFMEHVVARSA